MTELISVLTGNNSHWVNFDTLFASDDIDSITRSIVKILINEADKAIPN